MNGRLNSFRLSKITMLAAIFIILFLACANISNLESTEAATQKSSVTSRNTKFFISMNDLAPDTKKLLANRQISMLSTLNVYDSLENNLLFDSARLVNDIKKAIPDKMANGYACLDWESANYKILQNQNPTSAEYSNACAAFLKAYRLAKRIRPAMQWGFYGLPVTSYWGRNDKWRNQTMALTSLLGMMDVIYLSLYDLYTDEQQNQKLQNDYIEENLKQGLQLSSQINKPLLVFICHRFHESNKQASWQLIPWSRWSSDIDHITKVNYNGKTTEGIIWWAADEYLYRTKIPAIQSEIGKSKMDVSIYHQKQVLELSYRIDSLLKK